METGKLKKFAQFARRSLFEQVTGKLKIVLAENSAARRESVKAIQKLEESIRSQSKEQVIERVAYIWFNRFCALRFMDVNRYNRVNVISPADPGQFQPEILTEAKMGHIDEEMATGRTRQQIFDLLDGKAPSGDPQGEAYRLLVVAACNFWNKAMPFLFERIDDYTELLMPDDLLSGNSILAYTREAMTPDLCGVGRGKWEVGSDEWEAGSGNTSSHSPLSTSHSSPAGGVEVIGWLYQFYISEKKDDVFAALKKGKKITPENIPAATQLFTPHWIVRYLVENSLGRLWMLNHPGSKLVEQMDYYIKPEHAETDFLRIAKPEEIKICDPACGSGHMLTYAFDLLYAIYEEEGYEPAEIPEKILTHNLYGIEIDERAGELAAFALTMKARARQRRFFNKGVKPNICVLENVRFDEGELNAYMDFIGRDLFTTPLQTTLRQFEEADNLGSLIRPDVTDVDGMLRILKTKNVSGQLFISMTHQKVLQVLRQADYLSPKYHLVIANPPYMGLRNMSARMSSWLKENYPDTKTDLFASFVMRAPELCVGGALIGIMSPNVWMYISTHEKLRAYILKETTLTNLVELPLSGFKGATVQICAYNFINRITKNYTGTYISLIQLKGGDYEMSERTKSFIANRNSDNYFLASSNNFRRIPGMPIAYWVSHQLVECFSSARKMAEFTPPRKGIDTGNNDQFLRFCYEVSLNDVNFVFDKDDEDLSRKWFRYNKGGEYRKWFGNNEYVVDWENNGSAIRSYSRSTIRNDSYLGLNSLTWSDVTSSHFSARYSGEGAIHDNAGPCAFGNSNDIKSSLALLCSCLSNHFLKVLNPTLHYQIGNIASLPVIPQAGMDAHGITDIAIQISKSDWDAYETSWDFIGLPLLNPNYRQLTLKATYQKLRTHWQEMTLEMQRLEQENNRIFIEAYGMQDELTPGVPLNEITLTCNPHYRYGSNKSEDELEDLLLADTMRELVSYAVGCMLGRYSLDKPGLILADQGETIEDYHRKIREPQMNTDGHGSEKNICENLSSSVVQPSFPADADNVIPILDGEWFEDDIVERFKQFLKVTFGAEHYEENLQFLENALYPENLTSKKRKTIRDYFVKEFYTHHVKLYKKRPIYWLFSSPKGSFNALIYMHRYRPDTVSVVLNDYLREFRAKLTSHKNHLEEISISGSAGKSEKAKALKEIEKLTKTIVELEDYEREILYPLATEQIEIDLDDGVKVNYVKFGKALKNIPGLEAKED